MRERTSLVGGKLTITSGAAGTEVCAEVPLDGR
jgi:signal transduction histidine kinase